MTAKTEASAAASDRLPVEMRDPVVAYLVEQAEKFRVLQDCAAAARQPDRRPQKTFEAFLSEGRPRCADLLEARLKSRSRAAPATRPST